MTPLNILQKSETLMVIFILNHSHSLKLNKKIGEKNVHETEGHSSLTLLKLSILQICTVPSMELENSRGSVLWTWRPVIGPRWP